MPRNRRPRATRNIPIALPAAPTEFYHQPIIFYDEHIQAVQTQNQGTITTAAYTHPRDEAPAPPVAQRTTEALRGLYTQPIIFYNPGETPDSPRKPKKEVVGLFKVGQIVRIKSKDIDYPLHTKFHVIAYTYEFDRDGGIKDREIKVKPVIPLDDVWRYTYVYESSLEAIPQTIKLPSWM